MSEKKIRKRRLKSLNDVRRYLAYLIYEIECGRIEESTGGKLGYLLNILASTIRDGDLEERLKTLESKLTQ